MCQKTFSNIFTLQKRFCYRVLLYAIHFAAQVVHFCFHEMDAHFIDSSTQCCLSSLIIFFCVGDLWVYILFLICCTVNCVFAKDLHIVY